MRILTLNYEFPPLGGGGAPVSRDLAAEFVERGYSVDVVTMSYGDLPDRETVSGVDVYRVPCLRSEKSMSHAHEMATYLPSAVLKSRRLLNKHDYDFIHTHFIIPTGVAAYALSKMESIPYIITAHGSDVPGYNPDRFNRYHRVAGPIWRRIVLNANQIVSPSEYLADLIHSAKPDAEISVIPNGFNADKFDPSSSKEERILVTSRLFERKGIQHLLRAVDRASVDWTVGVTGDGPYKSKLVELAEGLDTDVKFYGWVSRERLSELLETSEIYVFPSSYENCPVSLQEAMAAGCAIIASERSGTAEVIGNAGVTLNPTNTAEFAEQLGRLADNEPLRQELQNRARKRVETEFAWSRIADQYLDVIRTTTLPHAEPTS